MSARNIISSTWDAPPTPCPLRVLVPVYDIVAYVSTVASTRHSRFGTKEGPRDGSHRGV